MARVPQRFEHDAGVGEHRFDDNFAVVGSEVSGHADLVQRARLVGQLLGEALGQDDTVVYHQLSFSVQHLLRESFGPP